MCASEGIFVCGVDIVAALTGVVVVVLVIGVDILSAAPQQIWMLEEERQLWVMVEVAGQMTDTAGRLSLQNLSVCVL